MFRLIGDAGLHSPFCHLSFYWFLLRFDVHHLSTAAMVWPSLRCSRKAGLRFRGWRCSNGAYRLHLEAWLWGTLELTCPLKNAGYGRYHICDWSASLHAFSTSCSDVLLSQIFIVRATYRKLKKGSNTRYIGRAWNDTCWYDTFFTFSIPYFKKHMSMDGKSYKN